MRLRKATTGPRGLTLIEVVLGLTLVSGMVILLGAALSAAVYSEKGHLRNQASALANQELAALQAVGAAQIPVQTNGPLLGILFSQGRWGAKTDGTAPSGPNVFEAVPTSSATSALALYPLPANAYADGTYTVKVKVPSPAPSGWRIGLMFRTTDLRNGYHLYLTADNLKLDKVVSGVTTNLFSDSRSISAGTWQTISVNATGSSLALSVNGTPTNPAAVTDTTFSVGKAALAVWGGGAGDFDDVVAGGSTWNFDTATANDVPDDWRRFGLADLPNGAATLTTAVQGGDSAFKRTDVTVTWNDRGTTKSLSQSTYIRN